MKDTFLIYKKFNSEEELTPFIEFLKEGKITYQLEEVAPGVDPLFIGQKNTEIHLLIRQDEFLIVDKLIEHWAKKNNEIVDDSHYLYEFTNEELIEIIEKSDEWSKEDFILAKKILLSKGMDITETSLNNIQEKRLDELRKPERASLGWNIAGYISSFLGGLLGIFIGITLNTLKKTLPNGERVYVYDESSRKTGARMLKIGILFFVLWIIYAIILHQEKTL